MCVCLELAERDPPLYLQVETSTVVFEEMLIVNLLYYDVKKHW